MKLMHDPVVDRHDLFLLYLLSTSVMYSTRGIEAVATITELRSKTSELVEHAKSIERGILVQKNNEPYAVLISYDLYDKLLGNADDDGAKRRGRKSKDTEG